MLKHIEQKPVAMRLSPRLRVTGLVIGAVLAGGVLAATIGVSVLLRYAPAYGPWMLDPANPRVTLDDVEREVIRRYPVADVSVPTLATMLASGTVTLFDVRTAEEFEAGHLPGAIRIEPDSSAEAILSAHRDRLGQRAVVFYCAVGVRSSRVLMETLRDLAPHSSGQLYNLRGGVFRWAAEGQALISGSEPGKPHPYDEKWGRLLARTVPGS